MDATSWQEPLDKIFESKALENGESTCGEFCLDEDFGDVSSREPGKVK